MLIALTLMVAMSVHAGMATLAMKHTALVILSYVFLYCFHVLIGVTRDTSHCIFTDIDECMQLSPCHVNAKCTNTKGSFDCECNMGYTGDGMNCFSMFTLLFLPLLFNLKYHQ